MPDSSTPAPQGGVPDAISAAQLEALLDPMPDATKGLGLDFNKTGGLCDLMVAIRSGLMDRDSACTLGQAIIAAASMANLVKAGFEQALERLKEEPSPDPVMLVMAVAHLRMAAHLSDAYDAMAANSFHGAAGAAGIDRETIASGKTSSEKLGKALVSGDILDQLGMDAPESWKAFGRIFIEGATAPDYRD